MAPQGPGGIPGGMEGLEQLEKLADRIERVKDLSRSMLTGIKNTFRGVSTGSLKAKVAQEELAETITKTEKSAVKAAKNYRSAKTAADKAVAKSTMEATAASLRHYKLQEAAIKKWTDIKDGLKNATLGFATLSAAQNIYQKRLDEINFGQRLFLSNIGRIGPEAAQNYQQQNTYIKGIKESLNDVNAVGAQWGMTGDEVAGVTKELAFALRGQIDVNKDYGKNLRARRNELLAYARAMNIDVKDALEELNTQLYGQGRSLAAASNEMADMAIMQNKLQKSLERQGMATKASASFWKEDYVKAFKAAREEMGGFIKFNRALGSVFNRLYIQANKAGLAYSDAVKVAQHAGKLLNGLSDFDKIQVGGQFVQRWRKDSKKFLEELVPGKTPEDDAARERFGKRISSIMSAKLNVGDQERAIAQALGGTELGISAILQRWKKLAPGIRAARLKEVMGEDEFLKTGDVLLNAIEKGDKGAAEKLGDAIKKSKERADKVKKEREAMKKAMAEMPKKLTDTLSIVNQSIKKTAELIGTLEDLKNSNMLLIASLFANTAAQAKGLLMQGVGAAFKGGGFGMAGVAGSVLSVAAAGAIGFAFGDYLDKKFKLSDRLSTWAWNNSFEKKIRKAEHDARMAAFRKQLSGSAADRQIDDFIKQIKMGKTETKATLIKDGKRVVGKTETVKLTDEKSIRDYVTRMGKAYKLTEDQQEALILKLRSGIKEAGQFKKGKEIIRASGAKTTAEAVQALNRAGIKAKGPEVLTSVVAKTKQEQQQATEAAKAVQQLTSPINSMMGLKTEITRDPVTKTVRLEITDAAVAEMISGGLAMVRNAQPRR